MAYTFDGVNKRVLLSLGTTSVTLADLYSRWKDWVLADNAEYPVAFSTVGGDIPSIPLYLFLENGWKIVPQAANHTLEIQGGVLEVRGGGAAFVDPPGAYSIRIEFQAPAIAVGYLTGSQDYSAVLAQIQADLRVVKAAALASV